MVRYTFSRDGKDVESNPLSDTMDEAIKLAEDEISRTRYTGRMYLYFRKEKTLENGLKSVTYKRMDLFIEKH